MERNTCDNNKLFKIRNNASKKTVKLKVREARDGSWNRLTQSPSYNKVSDVSSNVLTTVQKN